MAELLDLDARRSVEHDLDVNLFVEAGAGTGKTTTLVKRVVRLFATGRLAATSSESSRRVLLRFMIAK